MNSSLIKLDERINELHKENNNAKISFKELHKERIYLKKERELRQNEITLLENKCIDLQMLKFGRVIQLDELESGGDKTKEIEMETYINDIELNNRIEYNKHLKDIDNLQQQLAQVSYSLNLT